MVDLGQAGRAALVERHERQALRTEPVPSNPLWDRLGYLGRDVSGIDVLSSERERSDHVLPWPASEVEDGHTRVVGDHERVEIGVRVPAMQKRGDRLRPVSERPRDWD